MRPLHVCSAILIFGGVPLRCFLPIMATGMRAGDNLNLSRTLSGNVSMRCGRLPLILVLIAWLQLLLHWKTY
ncbi:MAG: hypothetical protein ACD_23C00130G0003 [uncultured bacterium]|nr:MAG: hypothetical protein ACD_23C00130G0003 [uncultured bacterium]